MSSESHIAGIDAKLAEAEGLPEVVDGKVKKAEKEYSVDGLPQDKLQIEFDENHQPIEQPAEPEAEVTPDDLAAVAHPEQEDLPELSPDEREERQFQEVGAKLAQAEQNIAVQAQALQMRHEQIRQAELSGEYSPEMALSMRNVLAQQWQALNADAQKLSQHKAQYAQQNNARFETELFRAIPEWTDKARREQELTLMSDWLQREKGLSVEQQDRLSVKEVKRYRDEMWEKARARKAQRKPVNKVKTVKQRTAEQNPTPRDLKAKHQTDVDNLARRKSELVTFFQDVRGMPPAQAKRAAVARLIQE